MNPPDDHPPMPEETRAGEDRHLAQPGDRVGAYTVVRVLGRRGSLQTYLARDEHGAEVALRIGLRLPPAESDGPDRPRPDEAPSALLARLAVLDGPDVVTARPLGVAHVTSRGRDEPGPAVDGSVSRHVDGPTILEHALRRCGTVAAVLEACLPLCRTLERIHDAGFAHEALRPSAVRLDGGQTVVIDPGVSRLLGERPTSYGAAALRATTVYTAPEQLDAVDDAGTYDPGADLFALGVMIFEMLTGEPPREIDGSTPARLARSVRSSSPKSLRAFLPGAPADLVDLLDRTMHLDRASRPPDVASFRAELERILVEHAAALAALDLAFRRPGPATRAHPGNLDLVRDEARASVRAVDDTLAALHAALGEGHVALVDEPTSATGDPPVSAARATALTYAIAHEFDYTGVWWVESDRARVEASTASWCAQLGIVAPSDEPVRETRARIVDAIRDGRHLVVLAGVEDARLVGGPGRFVVPPSSRLLITTALADVEYDGVTVFEPVGPLWREVRRVIPHLLRSEAAIVAGRSRESRLRAAAADRLRRMRRRAAIVLAIGAVLATAVFAYSMLDLRREIDVARGDALSQGEALAFSQALDAWREAASDDALAEMWSVAEFVDARASVPGIAHARTLYHGARAPHLLTSSTVDDQVRFVALEPGGGGAEASRLVTVDRNGTVTFLAGGSAGAFDVVATEPREGGIVRLVRGPRAGEILTASAGGVIETWDASSARTLLRTRLVVTDPVTVTVADHAPSGTEIIVGTDGGLVRVLDRRTGGITWDLPVHPSSITDVVMTRDGGTLYTAAVDGAVRRFERGRSSSLGDATVYRHRARPERGTSSAVMDLDLGPDETWFIAACRNGEATVWSVADPRAPRARLRHPAPVQFVRLLPDGATVLTGCIEPGRPQQVWMWSVDAARPVLGPVEFEVRQAAIDVAADGHRVLIAGDETVYAIERDARRVRVQRLLHPVWVSDARFDETGEFIVTGDAQGVARVWRPEWTDTDATPAIEMASFDRRGTRLVGIVGHSIVVFDAATGAWAARHTTAIGARASNVAALAFDPAGTSVVMGLIDGTIRTWAFATSSAFTTRAVVDRPSRPLRDVAVAPSGRLIVATRHDLVALDGDVAQSLWTSSSESVFSVAASADGRWFAAGLGSGRALIFSVDDPAHPVVVSGVGSSEVRVAFGPPDRPAALVAWSRRDGVLWCSEDVGVDPSGRVLIEPRSESGSSTITGARLGAGGSTLYTVTAEASVQAWDVATGEWIATVHRGGASLGSPAAAPAWSWSGDAVLVSDGASMLRLPLRPSPTVPAASVRTWASVRTGTMRSSDGAVVGLTAPAWLRMRDDLANRK